MSDSQTARDRKRRRNDHPKEGGASPGTSHSSDRFGKNGERQLLGTDVSHDTQVDVTSPSLYIPDAAIDSSTTTSESFQFPNSNAKYRKESTSNTSGSSNLYQSKSDIDSNTSKGSNIESPDQVLIVGGKYQPDTPRISKPVHSASRNKYHGRKLSSNQGRHKQEGERGNKSSVHPQIILNEDLPIVKSIEEFKHGEPDPPEVLAILNRNYGQKNVTPHAKKNVMPPVKRKAMPLPKRNNNVSAKNEETAKRSSSIGSESNTVAPKSSMRAAMGSRKRRRSPSPVTDTQDDEFEKAQLAPFGENEYKNKQWWVKPVEGEAYPKCPEYSTWCQVGEDCLGLRDFTCLLRHKYQEDYWLENNANLSALPVDPDGLGSRDPPVKRKEQPLEPPSAFFQYTGEIKGAATGRDWKKRMSEVRHGSR